MSKSKYKKPEWFDLQKYEKARNLNPSKWATELHIRHYLLRDDFATCYNKEQFLTWFEAIKINGVLDLEEIENVLNKANEGIIYHKDFIEKNGNNIKYAESIRQDHAANNLFTESVEALTASDINQLNKGLDADLKTSCDTMWNLFNESTEEPISSSRKKIINDACQLYGVQSSDSELAVLEIDLTAPNEMILSDFKKVLFALRKIKPLSTNAKALKAKDWNINANRLTDNLTLPFLDLLIHSKTTNTKLTNDIAQDILCGHNADGKITQKVQRTIKPNALTMIKTDEIRALRALYFSKPSEYWNNS